MSGILKLTNFTAEARQAYALRAQAAFLASQGWRILFSKTTIEGAAYALPEGLAKSGRGCSPTGHEGDCDPKSSIEQGSDESDFEESDDVIVFAWSKSTPTV